MMFNIIPLGFLMLLIDGGGALIPHCHVPITQIYDHQIGSSFRRQGGLRGSLPLPEILSLYQHKSPRYTPPATFMQTGEGAKERGGDGSAVLVVGATGRTGSKVVRELYARGETVKAMTRDPHGARAKELVASCQAGSGVVEVVQGDVANYSTVLEAMKGCRACVACHGSVRPTNVMKDSAFKIWDPTNEMLGAWGPSRPAVIPAEYGEDFSWLDPATEDAHPWNTHYAGVNHIVDAALEQGCGHVIVVSDNLCGLDPIHPAAVSNNLRFSMGLKWRSEGEVSLRNAAQEGLVYTLIRAPQLTDEANAPEGLALGIAPDGECAPGSTLGRHDLAMICTSALYDPLSHNATVSCAWGPVAQGSEEFSVSVPEGGSGVLPEDEQEGSFFSGPDMYENRRRAHSHTAAAVVFGSLFLSTYALVHAGVLTQTIAEDVTLKLPFLVVPMWVWSRLKERRYYPGQIIPTVSLRLPDDK